MSKFTYQYQKLTPTEKREIETIRQKYATAEVQEEITKIKQYDKRAKGLPLLFLYSLLIVGILIFGTGLTCVLVWNELLLGCLVMLFGTGIICITGFFYSKFIFWCKKYYGKKILLLAENLKNKK